MEAVKKKNISLFYGIFPISIVTTIQQMLKTLNFCNQIFKLIYLHIKLYKIGLPNDK